MPDPIQCVRLFADADDESHFDDVEIDMSAVQYTPPAPTVDVSAPVGAKSFVWIRRPEDWEDDAHPTPRRQLFVILEGRAECWTSTGDRV